MGKQANIYFDSALEKRVDSAVLTFSQTVGKVQTLKQFFIHCLDLFDAEQGVSK